MISPFNGTAVVARLSLISLSTLPTIAVRAAAWFARPVSDWLGPPRPKLVGTPVLLRVGISTQVFAAYPGLRICPSDCTGRLLSETSFQGKGSRSLGEGYLTAFRLGAHPNGQTRVGEQVLGEGKTTRSVSKTKVLAITTPPVVSGQGSRLEKTLVDDKGNL